MYKRRVIKMKQAVRPRYKRKFANGKTVGYMFLPPNGPLCTSRCTGCYMLASQSFKNRVPKSEERIIKDITYII